jgi:hypothetical protein
LVVHGKRLTDADRQAIEADVEAGLADVVATARAL